MSQVTDSAFGDAAQSAYTYQPDTTATDRKDGNFEKSKFSIYMYVFDLLFLFQVMKKNELKVHVFV